MRRRLFAGILSLAIISLGAFAFALHTAAAGDLKPRDARKMIAHLAGIDLPSEGVRIKEVTPTGNSALVVAQVETAFRFVKEGENWRVAEIRTGNNKWEDVNMLVSALNAQKAALARAELGTIATALESFKRERGFYLESKSEAALIDNLNPWYLRDVIRQDPWHRPYEYEGNREGYSLRSAGADGKVGTADDVVVSR
jgi:hypothetical protein